MADTIDTTKIENALATALDVLSQDDTDAAKHAHAVYTFVNANGGILAILETFRDAADCAADVAMGAPGGGLGGDMFDGVTHDDLRRQSALLNEAIEWMRNSG